MWTGAVVSIDYKWSLRGLDDDSEEYRDVQSKVHLRSAQNLLDCCLSNRLTVLCTLFIVRNDDFMKKDSYICCIKYFIFLSGLYIKFGQGIATMNHVLPKEYTETLQILQDKCLRRESSDEIYQVFCTNHRDISVYGIIVMYYIV